MPRCSQLQLNTYPPRITREIANCVRVKEVGRDVDKLFDKGWLTVKITAAGKGKPSWSSAYVKLHGWSAGGSGREYCVVRCPPLIACLQPETVRTVDEDLRRAFSLAKRISSSLRKSPGNYERQFRKAFGVSTNKERANEVAGVYDSFVGHMVKGMVVEATSVELQHDRSDGKPPSVPIAHVNADNRTLVFLDKPFFEQFGRDSNFRAAILIHEFCHAWGMAGHPGTGNYGGGESLAIVKRTLARLLPDEYNGHLLKSAYEEHPLVMSQTLQGALADPEKAGFLQWEQARVNAYSYGNFALWFSRAEGGTRDEGAAGTKQ